MGNLINGFYLNGNCSHGPVDASNFTRVGVIENLVSYMAEKWVELVWIWSETFTSSGKERNLRNVVQERWLASWFTWLHVIPSDAKWKIFEKPLSKHVKKFSLVFKKRGSFGTSLFFSWIRNRRDNSNCLEPISRQQSNLPMPWSWKLLLKIQIGEK